jgi:uncharacterized membrane protein YidH (DUF202 family)
MSEPRALQAERTMLAWSRTVLALTAVAALIARTADSGFERGVAISLATAGLGLAVLTATRRRLDIAGEPVPAPAGSTFGGLLAALAALLAAGVVVIL